MNRRRFDESIVMGTLSGGTVAVLSNAVQHNISAEVGGIVSLFFSLGYAGYIKIKHKHPTDFEKILEANRKSVVKLLLSAVNDDFTTINQIFEKAKLEGFDFNKESGKIILDDNNINYNSVRERFDNLPHIQNILGFITYEEYEAVYNYLKYSVMFIDHLDNYQNNILELRAEQAKKMLELFKDEVNNYHALKEWKNIFP